MAKTKNLSLIGGKISEQLSAPCYQEDLANIIYGWSWSSNIDVANFAEYAEKFSFGPIGACAICGKGYVYGGNNPRPVVKDEGARCCIACHSAIVVPARMESVLFATSVRRRKWDIYRLSINLPPEGIVQYIREAGPVKFVTPTAIYNIIEVEYSAPMYTFHQADSNEPVILDSQNVKSVMLCNSATISMYVISDGFGQYWDLDANYDKGDEIKAGLKQAANLEGYINGTLGLDTDSDLMVRVRPCFKQKSDENKGQPVDDFEMKIVCRKGQDFVTCADGMLLTSSNFLGLGMDQVKALTRALMRKLIPTD